MRRRIFRDSAAGSLTSSEHIPNLSRHVAPANRWNNPPVIVVTAVEALMTLTLSSSSSYSLLNYPSGPGDRAGS
jgi:hypothetical protein